MLQAWSGLEHFFLKAVRTYLRRLHRRPPRGPSKSAGHNGRVGDKMVPPNFDGAMDEDSKVVEGEDVLTLRRRSEGRNSFSRICSKVLNDKCGPPMIKEDWVVPRKPGPRVAGLGHLAWVHTHRGLLFPIDEHLPTGDLWCVKSLLSI